MNTETPGAMSKERAESIRRLMAPLLGKALADAAFRQHYLNRREVTSTTSTATRA